MTNNQNEPSTTSVELRCADCDRAEHGMVLVRVTRLWYFGAIPGQTQEADLICAACLREHL